MLRYPGQACHLDTRRADFWERWGCCHNSISLVLCMHCSNAALQGGFAKCYEVQDLESKENFAASASNILAVLTA